MADYHIAIDVKEVQSDDDLALAVEEVLRLLRQGFTSGQDRNLTWTLDEVEEIKTTTHDE